MRKKVSILVRVPTDRSFVGELIVNVDGTKTLFPVSCMVSPEINGVNPAVAKYAWIKTVDVTNEDDVIAYGEKVVFFQGLGSEVMLSIHGGECDLAGELLATEGGLRLRDSDLMDLCHLIEDSSPLLAIEEYKLGFFKKMTGGKVSQRSIHPRYYRASSSYVPNNSHTTYSNTGLDTGDILLLMWLFSDHSSAHAEAPVIVSGGGGEYHGGGASGRFPEEKTEVSTEGNPDAATIVGDPVIVVEQGAADALPLIADPFANDPQPEVTSCVRQDFTDPVAVQEAQPVSHDVSDVTEPVASELVAIESTTSEPDQPPDSSGTAY